MNSMVILFIFCVLTNCYAQNIEENTNSTQNNLEEINLDNNLVWDSFDQSNEDSKIDDIYGIYKQLENGVSATCFEYLTDLSNFHTEDLSKMNIDEKRSTLKAHKETYGKFDNSLKTIVTTYQEGMSKIEGTHTDNKPSTNEKDKSESELKFVYNDGYKSEILNFELVSKYPGSYYYERLYNNNRTENGNIYIDYDHENEDLIVKYMNDDSSLIDEIKEMNIEKKSKLLNDLSFLKLPIKVQFVKLLSYVEENVDIKVMNCWRNRKMVVIDEHDVPSISKELRKNGKTEELYNDKLLKDIHYNNETESFSIDISMKYFDLIENYLSNNRKWNSTLSLIPGLKYTDIINEMINYEMNINEKDKNELEKAWINVRHIYINGTYNERIENYIKTKNQFVSAYLKNIDNEKLHDDGYLYVNITLKWLDVIEHYMDNNEQWNSDFLFVKQLKYSDILDDFDHMSITLCNIEKQILKKEWMKMRMIYINNDYKRSINKYLRLSDHFISVYEKNIETEEYDEYDDHILSVNVPMEYDKIISDYIVNNYTMNYKLLNDKRTYNYNNFMNEIDSTGIILDHDGLIGLRNYDKLYRVFPDTKLFKKKYHKYIKEWLGNEYDWELVYRASEHGYSAKSFHQYCDDVGPTLIIIKSFNDWIFGGYTTQSWSGNNRFIQDNDAFLFTLTNAHGIPPTRYNATENRGGIECKPEWGPTFCSKDSIDLQLGNDKQQCNEWNSCMINNNCNSGYNCDNKHKQSLFVNTDIPDYINQFVVSDYEVFAHKRLTLSKFNVNNNQLSRIDKWPFSFMDISNIIDEKLYDRYLKSWIGMDHKWKRIYRASEHGYASQSFHEYCDNVGPTLIVIRSHNGYIFGGYTTKNWGENNDTQLVADKDAYIFTLKNAHGMGPTRYNSRSKDYGIICNSNYGPAFGKSNTYNSYYNTCISYQYDILINADGKNSNEENSCYINNDCNGGYNCDLIYKSSLFVNTDGPDKLNYFSIDDYEVFSIDYTSDLTPSSYLPKTKIVDMKYDEYIKEWFGTEYDWKLVYRASEHRYTSQSFHEYCDNVGPTLIVIRSYNDYIFGGYSTQSWKGNDGIKDKGGFIFTLKNAHGVPPTRYNSKDTYGGIIRSHTNAPIFGSTYVTNFYYGGSSYNYDIVINNGGRDSNKDNSCYINNNCNGGYVCDSQYKSSLFVNTDGPNDKNYFYVSDYEVFSIDYTSDLTPSSYLPKTKIVDVKYDKYLKEWLGTEHDWKLIYRASEHEYTSQSFHEYCDNVGPTLIVIRSRNGWIFGGYTTKSWNQNGGSKIDNDSFLFTLKNVYGIPPTRYNALKDKGGIKCQSGRGPMFGNKYGLFINIDDKNCNEENSCYINTNYNGGYEYDSQYKSSLFVNTNESDDINYFSISDYEVFSIDYAANLIPSSYLPKTKIVDIKYDKYLKEWLGGEHDWKLIYRASEHKYTASSFHQYCDDIGPTLIVMRSRNGWIFGGYTTKSWNQNGGSKIDNDSFLFTLKNVYGIPPTRYNALKNKGGIKCQSGMGPIFSNAFHDYIYQYDIFINFNGRNCNEENSCYIKSTYDGGYEYDSQYRSSLFVNTAGPEDINYFGISDYEVYTYI